jgi:hypothetical protein
MAHPPQEIAAAVDAYLTLREEIDAGGAPWVTLAELFTEDAVYIDPAWGRVEGIEAIRDFISTSMKGLEGWTFPVEYVMVDGDRVVVKWTQVLPGARPDGSRYEQSGYSTLHYGGGGRFSYEEDLLNMTHVLEDIAESGWRPGPGFSAPPREPERHWRPRP